MDKWQDLKEFVSSQYEKTNGMTPVGRVLKGFYKAIKDKMWSLEREEKNLSTKEQNF